MSKRTLDPSDLILSSTSIEPQETDEERLASKRQGDPHPPENRSDDEGLCDECRKVDWSSLRTFKQASRLSLCYDDLRPLTQTVEELANSDCKICQLLSTIKDVRLDQDYNAYNDYCVLRASPLSEQPGYCRRNVYGASEITTLSTSGVWGSSPRDRPALAVMRLDHTLKTKTIPAGSIDYSKLQGFTQVCLKTHKDCSRTRRNVPGLKLFDTKTRKVIQAPDQCEYLALSYVWGKQAVNGSPTIPTIDNSSELPPVVNDAISVTNSLGYSYIWVDRYVSHSHLPYAHSKFRNLTED